MFGSIKESGLDFIAMDETSYDLSFSNTTSLLDYPLTHKFFDNKSPVKRLTHAIEYLKEFTRNVDVLIQLWLPVPRGNECVLTTQNQPFILSSESKGLWDYREISKNQCFATDDDSEAFFGLPSLVFWKKFPMCTPLGFQFVGNEDDPHMNNARQLNLCAFLDLPVFEPSSGTCLGVVEIVTTSQNVNYRVELDQICKVLEAFDLRSCEFLIHPKQEDFKGSYEVVLAEIRQVLKSVCDTHCLPLAQTWIQCSQQGRSGCHCQQQSAACISVVSSAAYVYDPHVLGFYEACSELHLIQGEGIAGKALGTNQPCFATDITAFSRTEYPLADHARIFGLGGAVAIRLRSTYTGPIDFVLEFFLPRDVRNDDEQKQMLNSISSVIQHVSRSLRVVNDEELVQDSFSVKETVNQDESSWISHMLEAQQRGESVVVSMGSHKEALEEFKVIKQWDHHHHQSTRGNQTRRPKGRKRLSVNKRSEEKKRLKPERNISLPVLQQYFPGSLKDAAKSIGVCPTTLKRICREHGIMRWPSRKIKKVGHSLKKLQLIIDSVEGAEGTIQLGSFYTSFPELSSSVSPSPKPTPNESENLYKSQKTTSHSSSSGSHNSGSSLCCSKENTLYVTEAVKDERKSLVRTQSVNYHDSNEILVKKSNIILQDEAIFRVKVVFGEEKIRLSISQHCGLGDLQREIMSRFSINDINSITLKYLDDDSEWVLLTCDADLEECMDLNIASKTCTIKLFVQQPFHLETGTSLTANGSS